MFDKETSSFLKELFSKELKRIVEIYLFGPEKKRAYLKYWQEDESKSSYKFFKKILDELATISSNRIITKNFDIYSEEARKYNIERVPTLLIDPSNGYRIKYIGTPIGEEGWAFIDTIVRVSKDESKLSSKTKEKLRNINERINIKVFVTSECPSCPYQILLINNFAIENKNIESECINLNENYDLIEKYNIMAVPYTIINNKVVLVGTQTEEKILEILFEVL